MTVLVLLSGGIDSATCIAYYLEHGHHLMALFIDYGQPNAHLEREAALAITAHYKLGLEILSVSGFSAPSGYVPARNAALLFVALMNFNDRCDIMSIGIHGGTSYADCTPLFILRAQALFDIYTNGRVQIDAPFLDWTKGDIVSYAKSQEVPLHLAYSTNLPGNL